MAEAGVYSNFTFSKKTCLHIWSSFYIHGCFINCLLHALRPWCPRCACGKSTFLIGAAFFKGALGPTVCSLYSLGRLHTVLHLCLYLCICVFAFVYLHLCIGICVFVYPTVCTVSGGFTQFRAKTGSLPPPLSPIASPLGHVANAPTLTNIFGQKKEAS